MMESVRNTWEKGVREMRKHETKFESEFLRWIPEVDSRIFEHFKVRKIELVVTGKNGKPVSFKFEKEVRS